MTNTTSRKSLCSLQCFNALLMRSTVPYDIVAIIFFDNKSTKLMNFTDWHERKARYFVENVAPILEIGYYATYMYNFKYKIVFHVVVAVGTSLSVGWLGTLTMVTDHSPLFVFKSIKFRPVSTLIFVLCIVFKTVLY